MKSLHQSPLMALTEGQTTGQKTRQRSTIFNPDQSLKGYCFTSILVYSIVCGSSDLFILNNRLRKKKWSHLCDCAKAIQFGCKALEKSHLSGVFCSLLLFILFFVVVYLSVLLLMVNNEKSKASILACENLQKVQLINTFYLMMVLGEHDDSSHWACVAKFIVINSNRFYFYNFTVLEEKPESRTDPVRICSYMSQPHSIETQTLKCQRPS